MEEYVQFPIKFMINFIGDFPVKWAIKKSTIIDYCSTLLSVCVTSAWCFVFSPIQTFTVNLLSVVEE